MGLFAGILVAWALFWFAASVFNSLGGTSARNALQLVGLWLVLVIVIPGLVHVAVDTSIHRRQRLISKKHVKRVRVEGKLRGVEGNHDRDAKAPDPKEQIALKKVLARSEPPMRLEDKSVPPRLGVMATFASRPSWFNSVLKTSQVLEAYVTSVLKSKSIPMMRSVTFSSVTLSKIRRRHRKPREIPTLEFEEEFRRAGTPSTRILLLLIAVLIVLALPRLRHIGRLTR